LADRDRTAGTTFSLIKPSKRFGSKISIRRIATSSTVQLSPLWSVSGQETSLKGMLAAQLLAAHNAAMECYRRAMLGEQTFEGRRENLSQANGNPDASLELGGFDEANDSVDDRQPRPNRTLGIVLMRSRVAEINKHAIAHVFRDKAIEPGDGLGYGAVVDGDDLAQILSIEARRELGRADQIAEHNRQLSTFDGGRGYRRIDYRNDIAAQGCNCRE
jgi:hypothetical protein